jgi:tetratricopeptide (TPR) repeat protein
MSSSSPRRHLALILLTIAASFLVIAMLAVFLLRSKIADVVCAYGEASFQEGRIDRALSDYEWAILIDPHLSVAFSDRGAVWDLKGEYDKAIADFEEATRLDPHNSKAFNNRGLTWLHKGEPDKALSDFTEAIRVDARNATAIGNRGLVWYLKGDLDHAFADYNDGIRIDSKLAQNFDFRGLAWTVRGEYEKAIADYTEAIRLDPNRPTAFNNLAWLEATCPKPEFRDGKKAIEHATRACKLNAWKRPNNLSTLAAAYAETGDFSSAVTWMEKAIELAHDASPTPRSTLEQYKAHKPYREAGSETKASLVPPAHRDFHF